MTKLGGLFFFDSRCTVFLSRYSYAINLEDDDDNEDDDDDHDNEGPTNIMELSLTAEIFN